MHLLRDAKGVGDQKTVSAVGASGGTEDARRKSKYMASRLCRLRRHQEAGPLCSNACTQSRDGALARNEVDVVRLAPLATDNSS